jgi:hypothetical protein
MTNIFVKPDNVVSQDVGDETIILDLKGGLYFGLDAVGSRIWCLLINGTPLPAITEMLLEEYEVDRKTVDADVDLLTQELVQKGLLVPKLDPSHAAT